MLGNLAAALLAVTSDRPAPPSRRLYTFARRRGRCVRRYCRRRVRMHVRVSPRRRKKEKKKKVSLDIRYLPCTWQRDGRLRKGQAQRPRTKPVLAAVHVPTAASVIADVSTKPPRDRRRRGRNVSRIPAAKGGGKTESIEARVGDRQAVISPPRAVPRASRLYDRTVLRFTLRWTAADSTRHPSQCSVVDASPEYASRTLLRPFRPNAT